MSIIRTALILLTLPFLLQAASVRGLFSSLDPQSIRHNSAFYLLHPDTPEGKIALERIQKLLTRDPQFLATLPHKFEALVTLMQLTPQQTPTTFSEEELKWIEPLSSRLANRSLKGHQATTEEEVLALPPEEIDLSRAIFLHLYEPGEVNWDALLTYEATIDLMALQILSQLPPNPTPQQTIDAINQFVFFEMEFRFPPHSLMEKEVDRYTLLTSVLDSRRGVCLGVSILYTCIAQRLGFPLELVTPPGHIYPRYVEGEKEINIEATHRGTHMDSDNYLPPSIKELPTYNVKEAVGLSLQNQASLLASNKDYEKAYIFYLHAKKYVEGDPHLNTSMGYTSFMLGNKKEAYALLKKSNSDNDLDPSELTDDVLKGNVDKEGLAFFFEHGPQTPSEALLKAKKIREYLASHPRFSAGYTLLAQFDLALHRYPEAIESMETFRKLQPKNSQAAIQLAVIYMHREMYAHAWQHLHDAEKLLNEKGYTPPAFDALHKQLEILSPE